MKLLKSEYHSIKDNPGKRCVGKSDTLFCYIADRVQIDSMHTKIVVIGRIFERNLGFCLARGLAELIHTSSECEFAVKLL